MKDKRALSLFPSPFISFLIDLPKVVSYVGCRAFGKVLMYLVGVHVFTKMSM